MGAFDMDNTVFKNQYRVASARLPGWDYTANGYYFVTIGTEHRQCFFGDVVNGVVVTNQCGKMIQGYWQEIPIHFPQVTLDQFVVMPNHIHGIIIITGREGTLPQRDDDPLGYRCRDKAAPRLYQRISPKAGSIPVIIRSFKSKCAKKIHRFNRQDFAWQQRYYDHSIKDEAALNRIRQDIINNPLQWQFDPYHPSVATEASVLAGNRGERIAGWFLRTKGYRVVATNFRVRGGEIDLVCRQGGTLVFVEVKTRSSHLGGYPEEAVTVRKMQRLQTAIDAYLQQHCDVRQPIRVDVVSVTVGDQAWPTVSHFQNVTADDLTRW